MRQASLLIVLVMTAAVSTGARAADYVFAWPFIDPDTMSVRGGTTHGADVTLASRPDPRWQALQAEGLSDFERDRRAILAMAGDYRTSFDFLETVVYAANPQPARPYRSWGTERVYVAADEGDFISLQHILVMVFVDDDGNRHGPFVQKHWRQDWRYQPRTVIEYSGDRTWQQRRTRRAERRGAWSQEVWQVDDSPRYGSIGRWVHHADYSAWDGGQALRPLPRRESSVRDDYDLLAGSNRHTILPTGWVHEQSNVKIRTAGPDGRPRHLARETGVNRYERIVDFDFSSADHYWAASAPYWARVRAAWQSRFDAHRALHVGTRCQDQPVFARFFSQAQAVVDGAAVAAQQGALEETFACFVEPR